MNIHCIVIFLVVVVQAFLVTAQRGWDSNYGYPRHHLDEYEWPIFEVRRPNPRFDIRIFDDDDYTQSLQRLHLFETFNPQAYLRKVNLMPDVYIEHHYPYAMEPEPIIAPIRLHTTWSVTYKTKRLPVRDFDDENKETEDESHKTSKVDTTSKKSDNNLGIKNSSPQGNPKEVKPVTDVKKEPIPSPEAEVKKEPVTKPENSEKSEPSTNLETKPVATDVAEKEPTKVDTESEPSADKATPDVVNPVSTDSGDKGVADVANETSDIKDVPST